MYLGLPYSPRRIDHCDGGWKQHDAKDPRQRTTHPAISAAANLMFGLSAVSLSTRARSGPAQVFSEFVATFGLVCVIWGSSRLRSDAVPFAVGAYITAAYWFTVSTSFANPAVTIARSLSDTFAGIRPRDIPLFLAAHSWRIR
jgi:glycerol uptake facilitator-like aquaporin